MSSPANRVRPTSSRIDPRTRNVEGHRLRLLNPRPDRVYKLAYKGCPDTGVNHYLQIGYNIVQKEKGGVDIAGSNTKMGQDIEYKGCVLVEIDAQKALEHEQNGVWGDTGQAEADRLEDLIIDKRGGIDPLRGMHAQAARAGMVFKNETEGPKNVLEEL